MEIIQHDNDPKHTSGVVQRYLANKKVTVMKWPAPSPDLKPIENLWAQLNRITMERKTTNEEELFEVLKRGWELLSIEYLHGLIESMPRRCMAVIKAKGMPTNYRKGTCFEIYYSCEMTKFEKKITMSLV